MINYLLYSEKHEKEVDIKNDIQRFIEAPYT